MSRWKAFWRQCWLCKQKNNEPTDFTGLLQTNFSVKGLVIGGWGVGVLRDGSFMDRRQRRTTSVYHCGGYLYRGCSCKDGWEKWRNEKNEPNPRSEQRTRTNQNLGQQTHAHNIIRWVDVVPLVPGPVLSPLLPIDNNIISPPECRPFGFTCYWFWCWWLSCPFVRGFACL